MGSLPSEMLEQVNNKIEEAFEKLRKEDQDAIKRLREENEVLKETLRTQQQELKTLRSNALAKARSRELSSPEKGPVMNILPTSTQEKCKVGSNDINLKISPIDNIYLLSTQYSDTDEEDNVMDETSSPVKVSYILRRESAIETTSSESISVNRRIETTRTRTKKHLGSFGNSNNGNFPTGSPPRKAPRHKNIELKDNEGVDENTPPIFRGKIKTKDEVEQIADSQEEDTTIISQAVATPTLTPPIEIPKNLTLIQTRQYLSSYYVSMLKIDSNFKINLFRNPIKQISWDFSDFVANKNYKPDDFTQLIKRNSIMDAKRFNQYKQFYNFNHNEQEFEDKLLQIFEKFESPPGFMQLDFPSTQELDERKRTIQERQLNRLARRIASCVTVENEVQVGEFVFGLDILNQYVVQGRWYIEES